MIFESRLVSITVAFLFVMLSNSTATAAEFRRELSTDRPDKTESPYTIESGHVQFELDLFNFSRRVTNSVPGRWESNAYSSSMNAKIGIHPRIDLQLVLGWEKTEESTSQYVMKATGFSDPVVRLKVNLLGNDSGTVAIGLMPFVSAPIGSGEVTTSDWQGGIMLPIAIALPYDLGLGMMYELDIVSDGAGNYHSEYVSSITTGRDLNSRVGAYVEFFQLCGFDDFSAWAPTLDFGLTFALNENLQLDCGVNVGLNDHADDINPFIGLSFRL
jgi:hypothetical protein